MTRFIFALGCFLIAFALVAERVEAAEPESTAEQSEASEENKTEAAAEKPEAKAEKKPEAKTEKPATHTVKPELLKIEVSLKGNFEAQSATEIVLRPDVWTAFKVLKAVRHGAQVERGDSLVELELEDIDQAIADQRAKIELAELSIQQAEKSLKVLESTTPMNLAAAERAKLHDDEDLAYFLKVDLPMSEKSANFNVETSENYLEYQKEELRQLEKMYKADDLTEETEEIVLKRQRDAVKRGEFYLEQDKLLRDRLLKTSLPRREESMKESNVRGRFTLEEANAILPIVLSKSRLELDKLKVQQSKDQERLEKLDADRALMEVKAPTAGTVYYGRFNNGEWSGASSGADKLRAGGSITANDVFMTIVKTRPMSILLKVPEKDVDQLRRGLKGKVCPTGYPDLKLSATVAEIGAIPFTAGNFEARLKVNAGAEAEALMPGMSCSVKFVSYLNRKALTVPPSAVQTDELDDEKHFVMQLTESGKQKKRRVTIGKKTDKQVEILLGLEEGDEVLKEFPKE
ncbi:MAG: HlyD family efflux transporter periplasmic adaptor subunit [Planctomycetota bacterium]